MQHAKSRKPKGSTVCIIVMFASWTLYLVLCLWFRATFGAWPPAEITLVTGLLYANETWQLARFKLAKERGNEDRAREILAEENNYIQGKIGMQTGSIADDMKEEK